MEGCELHKDMYSPRIGRKGHKRLDDGCRGVSGLRGYDLSSRLNGKVPLTVRVHSAKTKSSAKMGNKIFLISYSELFICRFNDNLGRRRRKDMRN